MVDFTCGVWLRNKLKTRAEENVLALITALAPFERRIGDVISTLYDKLKVPPYSTLSLGQLQTLRALCVPLTFELDFKDRLADTQIWLKQLFGGVNTWEFNDTLPNPDTMAELILQLKNVAR